MTDLEIISAELKRVVEEIAPLRIQLADLERELKKADRPPATCCDWGKEHVYWDDSDCGGSGGCYWMYDHEESVTYDAAQYCASCGVKLEGPPAQADELFRQKRRAANRARPARREDNKSGGREASVTRRRKASTGRSDAIRTEANE